MNVGLFCCASGCVLAPELRPCPDPEAEQLAEFPGEPRSSEGVLLSNTPNAAADDSARDIWLTSCSMCHGRDGSAQTWAGRRYMVRDLTARRWRANVTVERTLASIRDGVPDTKMRAFGHRMTAKQLEELARWVLLLAPEQPTAAGKPLDDAHPEESSLPPASDAGTAAP